jgi:hypothetical protein
MDLELLKSSFKYLDVDDVYACMRVCSTWLNEFDETSVWKKNCVRDFPGFPCLGTKAEYNQFVQMRNDLQDSVAECMESTVGFADLV